MSAISRSNMHDVSVSKTPDTFLGTQCLWNAVTTDFEFESQIPEGSILYPNLLSLLCQSTIELELQNNGNFFSRGQ